VTIQHQLTNGGYDVDLAISGEDAIDKLEKNSVYNMIITDLRMYAVSGVDVLKEVIKIKLNIPVMVITGFGSGSTLFKEAMELKPCGYAFKPFAKEELMEKIRVCLNRKN
jgi:DNA-binding NtrC family response regulator